MQLIQKCNDFILQHNVTLNLHVKVLLLPLEPFDLHVKCVYVQTPMCVDCIIITIIITGNTLCTTCTLLVRL